MQIYSHLKIIIPVGLIIGGSMELFMIKTGFYEIVTQKEANRINEKWIEQDIKRKKYLETKYKIELELENNNKME